MCKWWKILALGLLPLMAGCTGTVREASCKCFGSDGKLKGCGDFLEVSNTAPVYYLVPPTGSAGPC